MNRPQLAIAGNQLGGDHWEMSDGAPVSGVRSNAAVGCDDVDRAPFFPGAARVVFGSAVAVLGVENLIWSKTTEPSIPILPFVPPYALAAWLIGLALLALGLSIAARVRARASAVQLGILLAVCAVLLQFPPMVAKPLDVGLRTGFFEVLALAGASLALAGVLPADGVGSTRRAQAIAMLGSAGRWLFAISAVVFGVDHFELLSFIASLVPFWIPGALFWAWVTGAGFIAAGICIAVRRLQQPAAILLGTMFGLWFVVLHAPRVLGLPFSGVPQAPHNPHEWSSAFIALAMCGASWVFVQRRAAAGRETTDLAGAAAIAHDVSASAAA